ncbi:MAG: hypothetical protein IJF42_02435 [Clostridia bacterium]|nr:hypothetical protein [Clostridia bacterium]
MYRTIFSLDEVEKNRSADRKLIDHHPTFAEIQKFLILVDAQRGDLVVGIFSLDAEEVFNDKAFIVIENFAVEISDEEREGEQNENRENNRCQKRFYGKKSNDSGNEKKGGTKQPQVQKTFWQKDFALLGVG